jgi:peroxiredoxin
MKLVQILAAVALLWPAAAHAFDVGPATGSQIPPLHATDAAGKPADLTSITGKSGVVLIFFRSAKWCPFCQKQLIEFRDAQAPLEARGYKLAAISYDPPEILTQFAKQREIGYTLLSDTGSVTIDAFGLRDPQYESGSFAYGVPRPVILIISPKGVILAKLAEEGYKIRPSVQSVLETVDGLGS